MTDRTWIGGLNAGDANDPDNWSPAGTAVAGDTLSMRDTQSAAASVLTLNSGNLAGDRLTAGSEGQQNYLPLTINLGGSAALNLYSLHDFPMVNVSGSPTLSDYAIQGGGTISIAQGATLSGDLVATYGGELTVSGAGVFAGSATSSLTGGGLTINCGVVGNGSFASSGAPLTVAGSVASATTTTLSYDGKLVIDRPALFQGQVSVEAGDNYNGENVVLAGLQASAYNYSNGVLSLLSGDTVEDTLRVQTPYSVAVTEDAGGVTAWLAGLVPANAVTLVPAAALPTAPPSQSQAPPSQPQAPPSQPQSTSPPSSSPLSPPPDIIDITASGPTAGAPGGGGSGRSTNSGGDDRPSAPSQPSVPLVGDPPNDGLSATSLSAGEQSTLAQANVFGPQIGVASMTFIDGDHIGSDFSNVGAAASAGQDIGPFANQLFSDLKKFLSDWNAAQPGITVGVSTPGGPPVVLPAGFVLNVVADGLNAISGGAGAADQAFGGALKTFFGIEQSFLLNHTA